MLLVQAGAVHAVHEDRSNLLHRSPSVSKLERPETMPEPRTTEASSLRWWTRSDSEA
jgi:hypothetical protein